MRAAAVRYWPVLALTLLGAALRFPTLDRQSFWLDELVTASLLDRSLGDVLREIPRTEATPYLYYVVAWVWSSVFGLGEVGLRSLSALAGTATIPIAYGAGVVLVSRRAGLVAAALVATNPFLVWYSQEARSYALFALLWATSVLTFGLALRGDRRWLAGWALVSALAIATHYFGLFLVPRRPSGCSCACGRGSRSCWRRSSPSRPSSPICPCSSTSAATAKRSRVVARGRIAGIPKNLVVGYSFPAEALGSALAASSSWSALVLVARLAPGPGRRARCRGSLAAAVVVVPVLLAVRRHRLPHRAEHDRGRRPGGGVPRGGVRGRSFRPRSRDAALRALRGGLPRARARHDVRADRLARGGRGASAIRRRPARDRRHAVHEPVALAARTYPGSDEPEAPARMSGRSRPSASPRRAGTRRVVSRHRR